MAQKALNTESLHVHDIQTPIGAVHAAFSENGLCYLGFHDQEKNPLATFLKKNNLTQDSASSSFLAQTQKDLSDFFDGNFSSPRTPIDLRGTDFQKRVWASLLDIPFGEKRTYTQQAEVLGDLLAIRAVASANGANPISMLIPCHRVVGADGRLTGYAGGLQRKKLLLEMEAKATGQAVQASLFG